MIMRFLFTFLVTALAAGLLVHAQGTANITVKADEITGSVNHLIFGQNIEAGDNGYIFSSNTTDLKLIQRGEGFWDPMKRSPVPEMVNQSKSVGMSVLRYPGGCLAHNFDWRKTVGPESKKQGWLFGLDEYMVLCHSIDAIPLITVSDYALPANEMPENAASLVEYLNSSADVAHPWAQKRYEWGHRAPYNVMWFELGNESMHGNHRVLPRREYTAEQYAVYFNISAAAMRKVDPRIKIGIVMMPGAGTEVNCDWNHQVIHLAGKSADFVVIHLYAPQQLATGVPDNVRMQSMMATSQQVEEHLIEYHRMIQQQLGHDLPLAITEFNGAVDQPDKRFSFGNALECADLLRVFLKPALNVALANYWNFLNGAFGMLRTSPGLPNGEPEAVEPAFQLYELWAQHFGSKLVKVDIQSPRAEFPGAGSEVAAHGDVPEAEQKLQDIDLSKYSSTVGMMWPKLLNVEIQRQNSDFTIHLQNLNRSIYPVLERIPRPELAPGTQVQFSVSFDAKLAPEPGSAVSPIGIGLMDSRGWNQTHSGIGVDGITTSWKHFNGTYNLDAQTTSVDLTARLMAGGNIVSGTVQLHNLVVSDFTSGHDAAYPLLTSSASTSSDRRTVYLVVFNKSATESIPVTIHLTGFSAAKAKYWEVNGPSLDSSTAVTETEQGTVLPLSSATTATRVFPAHSMTAIEFTSVR